jgi:hypothetical protein
MSWTSKDNTKQQQEEEEDNNKETEDINIRTNGNEQSKHLDTSGMRYTTLLSEHINHSTTTTTLSPSSRNWLVRPQSQLEPVLAFRFGL